jgi:hypothetical protein
MQGKYLVRTLQLDAASCALFFGLCVGVTATVSELLGLPPSVVAAGGWICLPAAVLLAWAAVRPSKPLLAALVVANLGWVLASFGVWIAWFGQLTLLGHVVLIAQALAVELFLTLEWRGMKALGASTAPA